MGIASINKNSGIPKYRQIVTSIEEAILNGHLKKGDKLPSLNRIKDQNSLSRDTVLYAFNELKARGIVQSVVGKGYYVLSEDIAVHKKVFLLFDEFNSFKEDLFNAFVSALGDSIQVDIFFHHFNLKMFQKLINDNTGNYSYYVIMPANLKGTAPIIKHLPQDKVYILDQINAALEHYPSVYQNFKKDIYTGLSNALTLINKYDEIILVFSDLKQPIGILEGFKLFCSHYAKSYTVINTVKNHKLCKGELYVILDDRDLIKVIKTLKEQGLKLAKDIGIISYNDTLLKDIVEDGITTISTDFNSMGMTLAQMILKNEPAQIENPNHLIIRQSL